MQIRKLQLSDYTNWLNLWKGYQAFYQVSLDEHLSKMTFQRLLDTTEPMYGLILEVDQKAVGLVHFILHRSTWTAGDYCYLQDLFVDIEHRQKGYAKQLIEAVYTEADDLGCSRVYWLTHESNQVARQLYDQVAIHTGFIQYRKNLAV